MHFTETCSLKINLTLRVLGPREDGYHDVHSLYWRIPSPEVLEIFPADCDCVHVFGADIPGENILTRLCRSLRMIHGAEGFPRLRLDLYKHVPMGSGVGAGSGNAAAFLKWVRRTQSLNGVNGCMPVRDIAALGADVAFLASDYDLALADGRGELLSLPDDIQLTDKLALSVVLVFPRWASGTREAYGRLDELRLACGKSCVSNALTARQESMRVLRDLSSGGRPGLLPNDFLACALADEGMRVCYNNLYEAADRFGACAWGLCGSGSAAFALFHPARAVEPYALRDFTRALEGEHFSSWVEQIIVME